ncbi:MAG: ATP-binding protein [Panacagrimonas sp.]
MTSLRARLLAGLLVGLLLAALAAAALIYWTALNEANEVFDQHLRDTALTLRDEAFEHPFAAVPEPELSTQDRAADLVVQVFSLEGVRIYYSQRHVAIPGLTTLGFSDVDTPEGRWRVFGAQTPLHVIQVAQPLSVRQARAARLALRVLLPFALFVPLLGALVWLIVGRGLRPLRELAAQVDARSADALAPLSESGLPQEARPLVTALNAQLARVEQLIDHERAFLADAAHELRTPLTALRLQVQALAHAPESERARATVAILSGLERAGRLIEQLLALARQQQPVEFTGSAVALDQLARQVVAELLPLADARSIDLGVTDAAPLTAQGDDEALAVLLRNLVDNALRYTPSGGRVDVAVLSEEGEPTLKVSDTGPGIPVAERERVFGRFHRLPGSPAGGSGLGLALVRSIAERHGANVVLGEGLDGSGLSVSVRLGRKPRGCDRLGG